MTRWRMVRPPWDEVSAGDGYILCSCGQTLQTFGDTRTHWQMGHFDYMVEDISAQGRVVRAVEARGYRRGWNRGQYASRQIAKLTEELGELLECIWQRGQWSGPSGWESLLFRASEGAAEAFDDTSVWDKAEITDRDRAVEELADIVIPAFVLADVLGVDICELAVRKAEADVPRGVRGEANNE